jgi:hypothetical protein
MRNHHPLTSALIAAAISTPATGAAQVSDAGEEEFDRTPVQCISMRQIEGTQIVDDQNILFYRRGGRIYLNELETRCPTLKRNKLFRYRLTSGTRTANLCDFHSITVVDGLTGTLSHTCRLGMFHPISATQAEGLLVAPDAAPGAGTAVLEPIEVNEQAIPTDEQDTATSEP